MRWRAASIKVCDLASGAFLALFFVYLDGAFALGLLLTLFASLMIDAGEPQPGDPPKEARR